MLNETERGLIYEDGLLMYYAEANHFDQKDNFNNALQKIIKLHAAIEEIDESQILQSINIERLQRETEKALKKWLYNESDLTNDEMLAHFKKAISCIYYNNNSRKNKGVELFSNFLKTYDNF